jgi:hypothetical protein
MTFVLHVCGGVLLAAACWSTTAPVRLPVYACMLVLVRLGWVPAGAWANAVVGAASRAVHGACCCSCATLEGAQMHQAVAAAFGKFVSNHRAAIQRTAGKDLVEVVMSWGPVCMHGEQQP